MGKGTHLGEFEELVLLAVAGLGGDAHGAGIHEQILNATGRDVSMPSVYVTLGRLEKKGYVSARVDIGGPARGGRPRKVFSLKPPAVRELKAARGARDLLWSRLDFEAGPAGGVT